MPITCFKCLNESKLEISKHFTELERCIISPGHIKRFNYEMTLQQRLLYEWWTAKGVGDITGLQFSW